jgi:WD40 repeat protein
MKKLFLFLVVISALWQCAFAQLDGPEIKWVITTGSRCAQFTSDDRYIVANYSLASEGDSLSVIETSTGKLLRKTYIPSVRRAIRLSNDNSLIYSCGDDRRISIHKFNDLSFVKSLDKISGGNDYFDLSKDNRFIAVLIYAPNRNTLTVYDIIKDSIVHSEQKPEPFFFGRGVKFFNNDDNLAVADGLGMVIYDTKSWKKIKSFENGHTKMIEDFDISPDETRMVTCANDGKIILWDMQTGKKIDEVDLKFAFNEIHFVRFLENNDKIAIGGTGWTSIFDLVLKVFLYRNPKINSFKGIEVSNNKLFILSIESNKYVLIDKSLAPVDEEKPASEQFLYPNPTDGKLNFSTYLTYADFIELEIINSAGIKLITENLGFYENGNQNFAINVSSLEIGCYLLKLKTNKQALTYKFIIAR